MCFVGFIFFHLLFISLFICVASHKAKKQKMGNRQSERQKTQTLDTFYTFSYPGCDVVKTSLMALKPNVCNRVVIDKSTNEVIVNNKSHKYSDIDLNKFEPTFCNCARRIALFNDITVTYQVFDAIKPKTAFYNTVDQKIEDERKEKEEKEAWKQIMRNNKE